MEEREVEELASRALADMRSLRSRPHTVLQAFVGEHRTNQQMTGSTMLELLHNIGRLYSSEDRSRYFDGRNEHLGKICQEINELMESNRHDFWYKLPVI